MTKRVQGITYGRLMDEMRGYVPPKQHWGPIVTAGSIIMLFAKRGIGKTFLAYKIAHAIATGGKFLKWHGCGDANVLIFDGEMGRKAVGERLRVVNEGSPLRVANDALRVITYQDCGGVLWNLSKPEDQEQYELASVSYPVIVIDNLLTATAPLNNFDNDIKQWQRIQPWLIRMRDAGKAIILVHHAGKGGEQLGTSMRENIADTIIELRAVGEESSKFDLLFSKTRHFHGKDTEPLRVEFRECDDGGLFWEWTTAAEERLKTILEMHRGKMTPRQIADHLKIDPLTVAKAIYASERRTTRPETEDEDDDPFF